MQLNIKTREAIECIHQGVIGDRLLDIFFPNGTPIPKECSIWDYKESFDGEKPSYAELAKDILSFFNSYGGYIFFGVSETERDESFSIVGFDRPPEFNSKIKSTIESYSSYQIEFAICDLSFEELKITAVFVPRRPDSQLPAFLVKNGPEKKPGRPIFHEKTTYFRERDKTIPATIASQWAFLNSSRNAEELLASDIALSPATIISRVIPNNLPDKNLICAHLYGREDILSLLWAWIADELEPVRLLAGAGGKGKTSIAYEFASGFFRNAPLPFVQVLWMSAKRVQFRADRNNYMELPEYWYSSPLELLQEICLGTAALTQSDIESGDESEYTLQRKLRESLRLLPSFIIIDDIDSLQQTQQKRVFELVQQISAGAPSKFLLTTRANFAFSDTQCIQVPGLEGDPYKSFVNDRLSRLGLPPLKQPSIKEIQVASDGSPLWTDSILRLMKQGYSFQQALKEWKGKPGEDARFAALKKELEALSTGAKRILYAAAILRDCSRTELLEVTKAGKTEFDEAITELQTLFLVDAPKIIENEPRFSVPESTATAVRDSADDLVPDHNRLFLAAKEFIKRSATAKGSGAKSRIGLVVNQTIALLSAGKQPEAVDTVGAALKTAPNNPDLLLLKGRCLQKTDPSEAAKALNAAYRNGQRKPLLFELWYEASISQKQFTSAVDISNLAIDSGLDRSIWLPLCARANVQIGLLREREGSIPVAVDMLLKASADLAKTVDLNGLSSKQFARHKSDFCAVNDAAWRLSSVGTGLESDLLAFDTIKTCLTTGDNRTENIERLAQATLKLISGIDLTSDSLQARAGRARLAEATGILQGLQKIPEQPSWNTAYEKAVNQLSITATNNAR